jgi:hypothetical protein
MQLATAHISAMLIISAVLAQIVCEVVARPSDGELSNSALPESERELEQEESPLSDQHDHVQPLAIVAATFSLLADQIYSGCVVDPRYLHLSDSALLLAACRAPPAR